MPDFRDQQASWRYENRETTAVGGRKATPLGRDAPVDQLFSKLGAVTVSAADGFWDFEKNFSAKPSRSMSHGVVERSIWSDSASSGDERKSETAARTRVVSPTTLFEYKSIWDPIHVASSANDSDTSSIKTRTPSPEIFEPLPSPPSELLRGSHAPVPLYIASQSPFQYNTDNRNMSRHMKLSSANTVSAYNQNTGGVSLLPSAEISCSPSTLQMEAAMYQLGQEITNKLFVTPPMSPQMMPLQGNLQPLAPIHHPQAVQAIEKVPTHNRSAATKITESAQNEILKNEEHVAKLPLVSRDPNISDFEWEIILHMCNILWKNGWISVGRMGSFLHTATQNHDLPKLFKQKYGGLKKFVSQFPEIFDLADDHPFNPSLFMKACPQDLLTMNSTGSGSIFVGDRRSSVNSMPYDQPDDIGMSESELIKIMCDVLKNNTSVSVGRMGTTIVSRTQNHRLPRYFKSKFGGLKRFFEAKSDIFVLGNDHPFNPIVYLRSQVDNGSAQSDDTTPLPLQCTTAFPEIGKKNVKPQKRIGKLPPAHLNIPKRAASRLVHQKGPVGQHRRVIPMQKSMAPRQRVQSAPILMRAQTENSEFGAFPHYSVAGINANRYMKHGAHGKVYRATNAPSAAAVNPTYKILS